MIFTSGGTEANNLAVFGLTEEQTDSSGHWVIPAIEHPSILEPAAELQRDGWRVAHPTASVDGVVCLQEIESLLEPDTRLASLMLANNETGVLQPVAQMAKLCSDNGIPLHTDAAQAIGKIPVNFSALEVATMSCAAHKFHGPLGIGALIVRHGIKLRAKQFGGHQQGGLRPGTEMLALAVGMCTALECWHREADQRSNRLKQLRDRLEQAILSELPSAIVIGQQAERLPNTSNISFMELDRQALLMALDMAGVACSSGSACASGSSEPSPVLVAMGLEKALIDGSIRLSLGASTSAAEIDETARRILHACQHLGHGSNH